MQGFWLYSMITLLAVYSANCQVLPLGVCMETKMVSKNRWVSNRKNSSFTVQSYLEPVETEVCCDGWQVRTHAPLVCSPICEPECVNSDCKEPNVCVCHPGHKLINNSNATCYDICDSCVNGACEGDEPICKCYPNFEQDETTTNICNPVCSPACINAICTGPGSCKCWDGFTKHSTQENICVPKCSESCVFGHCSEPNTCSCFEGYINDMSSPSICLPVCNQTCENGECAAPDSCSCKDGFELHPRNPYHCVPQALATVCELKMIGAIKYDSSENCFVIKDKAVIIGNEQCEPLKILSQPICSHKNTCNLSQCNLNFRCLAKTLNSTNQIYCTLEMEDFEVETSMNSIIEGDAWSDVSLFIWSNQYDTYETQHTNNQTRKWSLRPTSHLPVCGQMHFAMEINGCDNLAPPARLQINSSAMTWISVILITSFVLLVGIGLGAFLWMRHRMLNNPLNYRENIMRGYNNESYEHQPTELVSDDDDDEDNNHSPYSGF